MDKTKEIIKQKFEDKFLHGLKFHKSIAYNEIALEKFLADELWNWISNEALSELSQHRVCGNCELKKECDTVLSKIDFLYITGFLHTIDEVYEWVNKNFGCNQWKETTGFKERGLDDNKE